MSITNVPSLIHNSDLSTKDKVVKAGLLVLQLMQTAPTIKLIEQCIKNGGGVIGSETIRKYMPEVYREVSNAMRISQNLNENGLPEEVLSALHSIMAFSAEAAEKNLACELEAVEKNKVLIQEQVDEAIRLKQLKDNQYDMLKLQYDQLKQNFDSNIQTNESLQAKNEMLDEQVKSLSLALSKEKQTTDTLHQGINQAKLSIVNLESKLSEALLSKSHLKSEAENTLKALHESNESNDALIKQNQALKDDSLELKFKLTNKETDIQNLIHKLEYVESLLKDETKKSESKLEIMAKQSIEKTEKLIAEINEKEKQTQVFRDLTIDQKSNITILNEKLKLTEQHNGILAKSEAQALELLKHFKS